MSDRKITQCDMILNYMRYKGAITQKDALGFFGCARLASRISDLRRAGYNIKTDLITRKVEYFGKTHYVRYAAYTLVDKEKAV